ncbi:MAG: hypothetical protein ABI840_04110 [bacterium]
MNSSDTNTKIPDIYFFFLRYLSKENKLNLIEKLTHSVKVDETKSKPLEYFYGIWESENSAEEIINEIRSSRKFSRTIEGL